MKSVEIHSTFLDSWSPWNQSVCISRRTATDTMCKWPECEPMYYENCSRLTVRGGADMFLDRTTSRCRRTESMVSLEREVCSCAELQVFSCYRGWKEACQATCVISTTSETRGIIKFFPARQGAEGHSRHSDWNIRGTCTIVCHRQKLGGPV